MEPTRSDMENWPDPAAEAARLRESLNQANAIIADAQVENERLRDQVARLQRQLTDPRRGPLCESKGCPRPGIGYVEQGGVRWLACDQHGGRTDAR